MSSHIFSHIFPFIYFFHKLKSLCQDNVNSYLKCTSIAAIFKWLTPRMVSTAKTARGSRTVHTPWAMINFDVKEGSEPNICWQPHLIRTSRNVNAFKVRGPTTSIATSSQMWSKELWYTSSTVCVWNWNLVREEVEASDEHVWIVCTCHVNVRGRAMSLCWWCIAAWGQLVPTLCYIVCRWFNQI